jgi:stress-induced morphogen
VSGYKPRFTMAEESGVTENVLRTKITQQLQATHVEIEDMSGILCPTMPLHCPRLDRNILAEISTGGCGQAFSAIIVSPLFEKKTSLARHRLVNTALKSEIAAIHAWTPKCYTPEQWEKQRQEGNQAVAPGKDTTGEIVTGTKD